MANKISNFLNSLHLTDDNDDDEYEEYVEQVKKEDKRAERKAERAARKAALNEENKFDEAENEASNTSFFNSAKRERTERRAERSSNKLVSLRGNYDSALGIEVCIPTSFEASQAVCDELLAGKAIIVNLEGFNVDLAQRVMDFISGSVYALNGRLHQISNYIFIVSPESVNISGDYMDLIKQNGVELSGISREH